jgi:SAM-dependent methyltransferase
MKLDLLEYVLLRLVRKFLFPECLLQKIWATAPYYRWSAGLDAPEKIVNHYWSLLAQQGVQARGKTMCELGIGATNGTLYEMVGRGAARVFGIEPAMPLGRKIDSLVLMQVRERFPALSDAMVQERVKRTGELSDISENSIDILLSNSVVEHMENPGTFFKSLNRILKPDGIMLHVVDYRDHIPKYPYHFLLFGNHMWQRCLNPGDLFRYRLSDHVRAMREAGFEVASFHEKVLAADFDKVRGRIHKELSHYSEADLKIAQAVLAGKKISPS